jgi:hypothetical protein
MIYSSERRKTHPLEEGLKHCSAVRYVAAEVRTPRVRITRELLRLCEVGSVVSHGESRTIEVCRGRATDVHHHALRVTIRTMYDVVLVKKTQALNVHQST